MTQARLYEGTFEEISAQYGALLAKQRVQVFVVEETANEESVERPFYETATPEEWCKAHREWAESHRRNPYPLSDEAIDRDSIYEGRG
ncbi:hypothetical protein LBMAG21_00590 [Armatimonadota bacterium]|nr:hypothetical protein [Armatimonadota bacterium]GDX39767.1 hypothetical protein LBMAG21_00590 [Armatimonadota bacterium]